jgi:hypothetical protein
LGYAEDRAIPEVDKVRRESPPGTPPSASLKPCFGWYQKKLLQRDPRGANEKFSIDLELIGKGCHPRKPPAAPTAFDLAIITQGG